MSIDTIFKKIEEQIALDIYPGASLAIYHQGKWEEAYLGLADPESQTPSQAGLFYDLASVSKVVGVGTLVIFLINSGQIKLDAPLQEYYPEFIHPEITIRQLLTHTSGLDPFIPNRNHLDAHELKEALLHLKLKEEKHFHYTDVNFLLLGFLLEEIYQQPLDKILQEQLFLPWGMKETGFGPVKSAVPTVRGVENGIVHDPKARLLGKHAGSAGLFSTISDLKIFVEHYLTDSFAEKLTQNISLDPKKPRSIAWNLEGDWLDHTGYTGTFILFSRVEQKAAIFLSNRTYEKDQRFQWILDRNELMELIKTNL